MRCWRSGRLPFARSFFSTAILTITLVIGSIRLVQVHTPARHAWLHSTHVHSRSHTRALPVQCDRTLTALLCALFAGASDCSSLAIIMYEETREDPRSVDLGASESDAIFSKACRVCRRPLRQRAAWTSDGGKCCHVIPSWVSRWTGPVG